MQYEGHISGGLVVFDDKSELPEGTRVLVVPVVENRSPTLAYRFQNVIGKATSLPPDMAAQHDHYIHGSPKR